MIVVGDRRDPSTGRYVSIDTTKMATEMFWSQVTKTAGCWIWTGARGGQDGAYGKFSYGSRSQGNRRQLGAHRYAYELLVGLIPEGFHLDHVKDNGCTSTLCVKAIANEFGPAHLEPVTPAENNQRSDSPTARQSRQTHCKRGHPLSGANLGRSGKQGFRRCRKCDVIRMTKYRKRKRAKS